MTLATGGALGNPRRETISVMASCTAYRALGQLTADSLVGSRTNVDSNWSNISGDLENEACMVSDHACMAFQELLVCSCACACQLRFSHSFVLTKCSYAQQT
jgi:hypothetical protein